MLCTQGSLKPIRGHVKRLNTPCEQCMYHACSSFSSKTILRLSLMFLGCCMQSRHCKVLTIEVMSGTDLQRHTIIATHVSIRLDEG